MNHHPHYTCDESGVTIRHAAPPTGWLPRDYKQRPVQCTVDRDRTLELNGEHFSAKMKLTIDQAIGLAMLLLFSVRNDPAIFDLSNEAGK